MFGNPASKVFQNVLKTKSNLPPHLLSFPAGMTAYYEVKSCERETVTPVADGVVRNYYVAAEKVKWNYAPSGKDLITGANLTEEGRWADDSERKHSLLCVSGPRRRRQQPGPQQKTTIY